MRALTCPGTAVKIVPLLKRGNDNDTSEDHRHHNRHHPEYLVLRALPVLARHGDSVFPAVVLPCRLSKTTASLSLRLRFCVSCPLLRQIASRRRVGVILKSVSWIGSARTTKSHEASRNHELFSCCSVDHALRLTEE